ncbi:hypothetical protein LJC08_05365 [Methanimicrococcus sp. OttesenSCG-928-J09]|nr:hypothetical protein [Methanimicrococcus sp. OttesenSCG-928-J09]
MATSSLTDTIIISDKKEIKKLKRIMFSSKPHNDVEVDVFEEMRKCEELL